MREIKFRFWDIHSKEMYDVGDIIFGVKHGMTSTDRVNYVIDHYGSKYRIVGDDAELMQYTGLKDYKGTEIYEGDIVRIEDVGFGQVMMEDGQWVTYREDYAEVCGSLYGWLVTLEVIGNIHQHPALLKEESNERQ